MTKWTCCHPDLNPRPFIRHRIDEEKELVALDNCATLPFNSKKKINYEVGMGKVTVKII